MNKLEKMINELCPNGVEYKPLSEIAKCQKGKQLNKELLLEEGYPVINGGINPSGYWSEYNCNENRITISQGGASAGFVNYMEEKFWAGAHCFVIVDEKPIIIYKFLYYVIKMYEKKLTECQYGAGIPALATNTINELEIPVPPLPIQEEIVRILDNFTELAAELAAELQDRKKQYEYYRDNLLTFNNEISFMKLEQICVSIKDGMHNLPLTNDSGEYPILSAQNINNGIIDFDAKRYVDKEVYNKEKNRMCIENGDVLLTIVATIGRTAVVKDNSQFLLQRSVCALKPKEIINPHYLKYYLDTNKMQSYMDQNAHGSAQAGLYLNQVANIEIPVPSLEIQERIVNVLDNFEKICNDLKIGLPAEIELRQKQYEYYRDLLLTFPENDLRLSKQASKQASKLSYNYGEIKLLQYVYGYVSVELNGIGTLTRGKRFVHADAVEQEGIPCIHYGELYTYYGISAAKAKSQIRKSILDEKTLRYANKGDVVIVGAGENNEDIGIGVAWLGEEPVAVHDACYTYVTDQNPKYISYFLRTHRYHEFIKKYVSEGKICAISAEGIGKAVIQLPSLEEQERIVSVLDKFDKYCNDIVEGLPAEIKYRQQQYNYYRDKLLTFKKLEA